jgi:hypothetical protein
MVGIVKRLDEMHFYRSAVLAGVGNTNAAFGVHMKINAVPAAHFLSQATSI